MRKTIPILLFLLSASCGEPEAEVPAEVRAARNTAARYSCAAQELAAEAAEDARILASTFGGGAAPNVGNAALSFARAFEQHALLRAAAYAQTDSALNHASTSRDSSRHEAAAARFEIRVPAPGSIEANVIRSYEQKLTAIVGDPDHPCSWKHELGKRDQAP